MITLTLMIKEDIEFERGLIIKLNVWKLSGLALFELLKQNLFWEQGLIRL
jgi:hypothetical protein